MGSVWRWSGGLRRPSPAPQPADQANIRTPNSNASSVEGAELATRESSGVRLVQGTASGQGSDTVNSRVLEQLDEKGLCGFLHCVDRLRLPPQVLVSSAVEVRDHISRNFSHLYKRIRLVRRVLGGVNDGTTHKSVEDSSRQGWSPRGPPARRAPARHMRCSSNRLSGGLSE